MTSTTAAVPLRVAFAGTPEFAAVALQALIDAGHQIVLVLTQPDRPAGRGQKLQASPVKQVALAHGLPVAQPQSLRLHRPDGPQGQQALRDAQADVLVVAAYGLILPEEVLWIARHGSLNIHASLLPRWRGAAPIHRAIEAGDAQTGITIMQMDVGLDTGPMLLEAAEPILADDTTAVLHDRLAQLGGRLIVQALDDLAAGRLVARAQPEAGVTYAQKIDKQEARVDWTLPAQALSCRLRAFDPFPGAMADWRAADGSELALKLFKPRVLSADALAALVAQAGAGVGVGEVQPGQVVSVDGALVVACGATHPGERWTALAIDEVQRAGGRRLPAREVLRSLPLKAGDRLAPKPELS